MLLSQQECGGGAGTSGERAPSAAWASWHHSPHGRLEKEWLVCAEPSSQTPATQPSRVPRSTDVIRRVTSGRDACWAMVHRRHEVREGAFISPSFILPPLQGISSERASVLENLPEKSPFTGVPKTARYPPRPGAHPVYTRNLPS